MNNINKFIDAKVSTKYKEYQQILRKFLTDYMEVKNNETKVNNHNRSVQYVLDKETERIEQTANQIQALLQTNNNNIAVALSSAMSELQKEYDYLIETNVYKTIDTEQLQRYNDVFGILDVLTHNTGNKTFSCELFNITIEELNNLIETGTVFNY